MGAMMNDPVGNLRLCYTPLASYIVDTPEAWMLSAVGARASPVTTATYKQFGDPKRHPPRTKKHTLEQLREITVDPDCLEQYLKAAQEYRLNGVSFPFFRDWKMSDPSNFLTPEPLHEWHKRFWDHEVKWAINTVGAQEVDFRFAILQPSIGFRHFGEGISYLKKVTGRMQRDVQRYLVALCAGAAPPGVLLAIRSLLDFCYLAQAPELDDDDCKTLLSSLHTFHCNKSHVITAGGRRGKRGIITNWHIPKIELLQNVVPSVRNSGAPYQWSADVTEHAHILMIKNPARRSNNNDVDPQICRYLDRLERCSGFELATSLRENQCGDGAQEPVDNTDADSDNGRGCEVTVEGDLDDDAQLFQTVAKLGQPKRSPTNYFIKARELVSSPPASVPFPLRTFISSNSAINLARDPKVNRSSIDNVAVQFGIPDLRSALGDYLARESSKLLHSVGGPRSSAHNCRLPFTHLAVWHTIRIQQSPFHSSSEPVPAQTVTASPPSTSWKYGRFDSVIFNVQPDQVWPRSGLSGKSTIFCRIHCINVIRSGHSVGELQLVFRPVPPRGQRPWWCKDFLVYVRRFDIVPQGGHQLDPTTSMHVLRRAKRANGEYLGGVIPLRQLRSPAHLVPRFGKAANKRLSFTNSHALSEEFWLNKYWDKETFYALSVSVPR